MLVCPKCKTGLTHYRTPLGSVYYCSTCHGRAVTFSTLAHSARSDFLRRLRSKASTVGHEEHHCPSCNGPMAIADFPAGGHDMDLQACSRCQIVWMDPKEIRKLPPLVPAPRGAQALPPALPAPRGPREGGRPTGKPPPLPKPTEALPKPEEETPDQPLAAWQYIPAILGLPVQVGMPAVRGWPAVTWLFTIACAGLFAILASAGQVEQAAKDWGFIPDHWARHNGLTLLTSMFLHGGVLHVVFNMYFLVIFGRAVEDRLGAVRYILLLLVSHVAGAMVHGYLDPRGNEPCIGASAAIAGVVAYYAIAFPYARIGFILRLFLFIGPLIRVQAYIWLLLFILMQIVGAWFQLQGSTEVAYLAHLGGLAVGIVCGLWARLGHTQAAYA